VVADIGRPVLYGALGRMLGLDDQGAERAIHVSKNLFNAGTGPTGGPLTPDEFRAVFDFLAIEVERRKTDRGDDIMLLAEHFLQEFSGRARRKPPQLTANARKRDVTAKSQDTLMPADLTPAWRGPLPRPDPRGKNSV